MSENSLGPRNINIEVERIVNLAKAMGWEKETVKIDEKEVTITLKREMELDT